MGDIYLDTLLIYNYVFFIFKDRCENENGKIKWPENFFDVGLFSVVEIRFPGLARRKKKENKRQRRNNNNNNNNNNIITWSRS